MNVLVRVEKIKGVGGKADHFHKAVVKRRGALGRKNKSNSNFFFPWAPPSGEKHAVSKGTRSRLNITNFLRYELLQEMLIGECLLARRQLICWKLSSPHKVSVLSMLLLGRRSETQARYERSWLMNAPLRSSIESLPSPALLMALLFVPFPAYLDFGVR